MHLLHLGTMRDIIASALTSWLLLGILQKHLGTGYEEVNKALHRFTYLGKQWAKTVGEELNIKDTCVQKNNLISCRRCALNCYTRNLHEPKLECPRLAWS